MASPPIAKKMDDTVAYYDCNAGRFVADTTALDMSALHERFLRHVPPGGRILDAGCGAGRDTLAFAERGYSVVAFDASLEMVRATRELVAEKAEVFHTRFEDVSWREEFSGIWACASLLHVPTTELPLIAARLANGLRPSGVFYMSFKHGSGERIVGSRRFTDHNEGSLSLALSKTDLVLAEAWITSDVRQGRSGQQWLNAIATRVDHHRLQR